jgi:hypothetical protein
MMKRADRIEQWAQALESGEYKQTKNELWNHDQEHPKYCCLGVVCVLNKVNIEEDTDGSGLNMKMQRLLGMSNNGQFVEPVVHRGRKYISLARLNDYGVKFKTIAKIIREQFAVGNFEKP